MSLWDLIQSETALTVAATVTGAVWTAVKSVALLAQRRRQRTRIALRALEAAVEATYQDYVRELKASRGDGKLTADERRQARQRARERAGAIARSQGIDLARELGAEFIDLWTSRLVRKLKRLQ